MCSIITSKRLTAGDFRLLPTFFVCSISTSITSLKKKNRAFFIHILDIPFFLPLIQFFFSFH